MSVGISRYPEDGDNAVDLIRAADSAMFESKSPKHHREILQENPDYSRDESNDSLTWFFQLQKDRANNIIGIKPLVCWHRPDAEPRSIITSSGFRPDQDEFSGHMEALFSLPGSLKSDPGLTLPTITFPLPVELISSRLISQLLSSLSGMGIPTDKWFFSFSEKEIEDATVQERELIMQLSQSGYGTQLADFGSVSGALHRLTCLGPNRLALAPDIIEAVPSDQGANRIAQSALAVSEIFDVEVVADGVASNAQHKTLDEMGYQLFDGSAISPLIPSDRLQDHLR